MKKIVALVVAAFGVSTVSAQQTPYLGLYYQNSFVLNPAAAGIGQTPMLSTHYRKQWIGIEGAPETQAATLDWGIENQPMGLGFAVVRDVSNVVNRLSLNAAYAYHLKVNDKHLIDMGVSAGAVQNSLLLSNVQADLSDPVLYGSNTSATRFDASAGVLYRFNNMIEVGFVAQQLFQPNYVYDDPINQESLYYKLIQHYVGTVAYRYAFKNIPLGLKPLVMLRSPKGQPFQFEAGLAADYDNRYFAAINYRNGIGYAFSGGIKLLERYNVGYLYELPSTELASESGGSHEFMLAIKLGKQGAIGESKELKEMKRMNAELFEKVEMLEQEKEALKKRVQGLEEAKADAAKTQRAMEDKKAAEQSSRSAGITTSAPVVDANTHTSFHYEAGMSAENLVLDERFSDEAYDFKVVVGSFTSMDNAKNFQKILMREYEQSSELSQDASTGFYHVYTGIEASQREAAVKAVNLKKNDSKGVITGEPWLNPVAK